MTSELVKILEAALAEFQESNEWFEEYKKTDNKLFWNESKDHDSKCRGLLKAYQIITGKNVYAFDILNELETLNMQA